MVVIGRENQIGSEAKSGLTCRIIWCGLAQRWPQSVRRRSRDISSGNRKCLDGLPAPRLFDFLASVFFHWKATAWTPVGQAHGDHVALILSSRVVRSFGCRCMFHAAWLCKCRPLVLLCALDLRSNSRRRPRLLQRVRAGHQVSPWTSHGHKRLGPGARSAS